MTSDMIVVLVAVTVPVVAVCAYFWRACVLELRAARQADEVREADILVNGGYHPSRIVLPSRRPLRRNFVRARDGETWWDDVAFPYAGMRRELPEGSAVTLDVGPLEPGEYVLFCGLGSIRGTLVIEDGTEDTGRVAIESADVTLISGSLKSVAYAIEVSRATMKNAKQSRFGPFVNNSLGILVAAGVLYPPFGVLLFPLIAGAATAASNVTAVMSRG